MVAHGLITGMLFFVAGSVKERYHTLEIKRLGGMLIQMPKMGWILGFCAMASLGLPGLAGFWGEFPAILSAYNPAPGSTSPLFRTLMVIAALGTVLAAGYLLWLYQRTAFGTPNRGVRGRPPRAPTSADRVDRVGADPAAASSCSACTPVSCSTSPRRRITAIAANRRRQLIPPCPTSPSSPRCRGIPVDAPTIDCGPRARDRALSGVRCLLILLDAVLLERAKPSSIAGATGSARLRSSPSSPSPRRRHPANHVRRRLRRRLRRRCF
jgi:hypothetical protein